MATGKKPKRGEYAEAAQRVEELIYRRCGTLAEFARRIGRSSTQVTASLRRSLPTLPPAAQNAALRALIAEVVVEGKACAIVPLPEVDALLMAATEGHYAA